MADVLPPLLLRGTGALRRAIEHHDGTSARAVGTGHWAPVEGQPGCWWYREHLTLDVEGASLPSTRSLQFRAAPLGGFDVQFADGRFFYHLPSVGLTAEGAAVVHRCGQDRYRGLVRLDASGRFHERWDVLGPAKGYTSISVLGPMGAPDPGPQHPSR